MIADAVRFIKAVRTKKLSLEKYSNKEIIEFAMSKGYNFSEEELIKAHRSLFLLFKK